MPRRTDVDPSTQQLLTDPEMRAQIEHYMRLRNVEQRNRGRSALNMPTLATPAEPDREAIRAEIVALNEQIGTLVAIQGELAKNKMDTSFQRMQARLHLLEVIEQELGATARSNISASSAENTAQQQRLGNLEQNRANLQGYTALQPDTPAYNAFRAGSDNAVRILRQGMFDADDNLVGNPQQDHILSAIRAINTAVGAISDPNAKMRVLMNINDKMMDQTNGVGFSVYDLAQMDTSFDPGPTGLDSPGNALYDSLLASDSQMAAVGAMIEDHTKTITALAKDMTSPGGSFDSVEGAEQYQKIQTMLGVAGELGDAEGAGDGTKGSGSVTDISPGIAKEIEELEGQRDERKAAALYDPLTTSAETFDEIRSSTPWQKHVEQGVAAGTFANERDATRQLRKSFRQTQRRGGEDPILKGSKSAQVVAASEELSADDVAPTAVETKPEAPVDPTQIVPKNAVAKKGRMASLLLERIGSEGWDALA